MSSDKPSTTAWIVVHLIYPLLPAAMEGFIRFVATFQMSIDTFSAATTAMSIALLSIFTNQSIRSQRNSLQGDAEEDDSRNGVCAFFLMCAIISIVLFAVIVYVNAQITDLHMGDAKPKLRFLQYITFGGGIFPVLFAIVAQRNFKLKASML